MSDIRPAISLADALDNLALDIKRQHGAVNAGIPWAAERLRELQRELTAAKAELAEAKRDSAIIDWLKLDRAELHAEMGAAK